MNSEAVRNSMLRQLQSVHAPIAHLSTAKSFNSSRTAKENMFVSPSTKWSNHDLFEMNERLNSTTSSLKSSQAKKRSHFLTVISQFPECIKMKNKKN